MAASSIYYKARAESKDARDFMCDGCWVASGLLVNKVFVMYPCYLVGSQFRSRHVNPMQMSFLQEGTE
jgi:hypothetical protein